MYFNKTYLKFLNARVRYDLVRYDSDKSPALNIKVDSFQEICNLILNGICQSCRDTNRKFCNIHYFCCLHDARSI